MTNVDAIGPIESSAVCLPPTTLDGSSRDDTIEGLTREQRLASGTRGTRVFIEAGPGTGKTTVSALRFGVERFLPPARDDPRSVGH